MQKKRWRFLVCVIAILLFSFAACQQGDASANDSGQSTSEQMGNSGELSADKDSVADDESGEENSTSQDSQENEKEESNDGWVDIEFPRP